MPIVDYSDSSVAQTYAGGRALDGEVLYRWGRAVGPFLPARDGRRRLLDLGAGTGIFARAWPSWTPCDLVALEPSAAMRAELTAVGLPEEVQIVAGQAEHLPLRSGSIDVTWISAVIHHIVDLGACARDLDRVTSDDGVVLIRGLLADAGAQVPPGLRFFPGWERVVGGFPTQAALATTLSAAGFRLVGRLEVEDQAPSNVAELIARVHRLRHADSLLAPLTDPEIDAGLAALATHDPAEALDAPTLSLLAFGR